MKLELKMDKQRARQLYELADRLSKLDVKTLSEEQRQQRSSMIAKLQEEVKGMAEGSSNIGSAIKSLYQKIYNAGDDEIEYFYHDSPIFAQYWDEYEGDLDSIIAEVDPKELQVMLAELESYVQNANLKEDTDGEYNDEAGMAKGSLQTMSRAVSGLMDTIQQGDNLPEWAQEKLSLAEDYLTTVWDYLLSQKEQGIEPTMQESKKPSPKLTPVTMKKTDPVSEEINNEAYERLQKVFAFKNYES